MGDKASQKRNDYYAILEVDPSANTNEIDRAYRRACETYSQENPALYTMFSPEEAKELLQMITEAYSVLSNPVKRKAYDNNSLDVDSLSQLRENVRTREESIVAGETFHDEGEQIDMTEEIQEKTEFDGPFLRRIRERKRLTLESISASTRVGKSYLKAIEEEQFDELPATVFVRGFVMQYARSLGLDGEQVTKSFIERFKNAREEKV